MPEITEKQYIADGVYARYDGHGITLTTENGISVQNEIYFEPETLSALFAYIKRIEQTSHLSK